MQYLPLGKTKTLVSDICLGTMTWGSQNSEAEAHQQMDYAVEHGINFFDAAELYPTTPQSAETQGDTEAFIGSWFRKTGNRDRVVLATKVTGKGPKHIDDGKPLSAAKMIKAIEGSLRRLQTDYIDLYQLHWPNRGTYHFRQIWAYDPSRQNQVETRRHMLELLECAQRLVDEGKIRHLGLSNETCWGTSQYLQLAEQHGLPRVVTIQNEYSLMQRLFDTDLAELSANEQVGLMAFSPLAAGLLSGKYRDGGIPEGSRRSINPALSGRHNTWSVKALAAYFEVADRFSLDYAQMALAFCRSRPFMTSTIIGATTLTQLRNNIAAKDIDLGEDVLSAIEKVRREFPIPM